MKRFQMTASAASNLGEIVRSAGRVNPAAAVVVSRTFLELFELLGQFPGMGSRRLAVTPHPLRMISIYQCLVVYRPETVLVEIVAIVPLADEVARLLSDRFSDEIDETELVLQAPLEDTFDGEVVASPGSTVLPSPG